MDLLIPVLHHDCYGVETLSEPACELIRSALIQAVGDAERIEASSLQMGNPRDSPYVAGQIKYAQHAAGFLRELLRRIKPGTRTTDGIGRAFGAAMFAEPCPVPSADFTLAHHGTKTAESIRVDRHVRAEQTVGRNQGLQRQSLEKSGSDGAAEGDGQHGKRPRIARAGLETIAGKTAEPGD